LWLDLALQSWLRRLAPDEPFFRRIVLVGLAALDPPYRFLREKGTGTVAMTFPLVPK
jgi:hypothetical protein